MSRAHPWSEYEELNRKLQEKVRKKKKNRDWPRVSCESSSSHPQIVRRRVSITMRGHTQRESKVLFQWRHERTMERQAEESKVQIKWREREREMRLN